MIYRAVETLMNTRSFRPLPSDRAVATETRLDVGTRSVSMVGWQPWLCEGFIIGQLVWGQNPDALNAKKIVRHRHANFSRN